MKRPTTEEFFELASLFVAGALSEEEARDWEHWLASGDVEALSAHRSASQAVVSLVDSCPPIAPSAHVRSTLLHRVAEHPRNSMDQTVLRASDDSWQPTGVPGIAVRRLGSDPASRRETFLLKFEAGAELPDHRHSQTEECFVLEGTIRTRGTVLQAGDFLRLPEGTMHGSSISDSGCIVLISAGMVEAPAAQSGA